MKRIVDSLLDLCYPERCAACDAYMDEGVGLCPVCAESLYPLGAACDVCAEPQAAQRGMRCSRCRSTPPPFRRILVPWRYGGELAVALRRLKYGGQGPRGRPELARPLGTLLAGTLRQAACSPEVAMIVPVPLHPKRFRQRGFSQAQAIAEAAWRVARRDVPLAPVVFDALVRVKSTDEQAGLSRAERARNVAGAFAVPARIARRLLGKDVVLVDDVVTTGATVGACARALRFAGSGAVDVVALARAES